MSKIQCLRLESKSTNTSFFCLFVIFRLLERRPKGSYPSDPITNLIQKCPCTHTSNCRIQGMASLVDKNLGLLSALSLALGTSWYKNLVSGSHLAGANFRVPSGPSFLLPIGQVFPFLSARWGQFFEVPGISLCLPASAQKPHLDRHLDCCWFFKSDD